jgi:ribonuclease HIII
MARKAKQDSDGEPKKVAMHTLKLDAAQAEKLRQIVVGKGWVSFPVDHSAFAFKGPDVNVVHYKSGKCVISGRGTEDFVKFSVEPDVTGQATLGYEEELNPDWFEEHAGLDESGKGDLFGPVVSACVVATGEMTREWIRLGIKDSKKLTDAKIAELDQVIRSTPGVSVKTTFARMAKYNELHSRFGKNLNRLLGWMHATSCEEALKDYELQHQRRPKWGLLDQFSEEPLVQKELARKGVEFDLRMRTKAESDPVVAAASIVARACFVRELERLSLDGGVTLPKGSGREAKEAGIELVGRLGPAILVNFAKLHFRTAYEVRGLEPPEAKPFIRRKKAE